MDKLKLETLPDPLDPVRNADQIRDTLYAPLRYILNGILPEGLALIIAAPKIGKSWWVLSLAIACATGGLALNRIKVDQRKVLYLALEDSERRIQDRLKSLGALGAKSIKNLDVIVELARPAKTTIQAYLERNAEESPLIIIDTLGRIRQEGFSHDAYQRDYHELAEFQSLLRPYPGASILIVHHSNKKEHQDYMNSVSGTQGLSGAVDTALFLSRERNQDIAKLDVTGRDVLEGEYALEFLENGQWQLIGETLEESSWELFVHERKQKNLSADMTLVLEAVNNSGRSVKSNDIAELTGMDSNKVSTYLKRLANRGMILRVSRGLFSSVEAFK